jgi:hypothetical protein
MTRTNLVLGAVAAVSLALAGWMYLEKRDLQTDLSSSQAKVADFEAKAADPWANGGDAAGRSGAIKPPTAADNLAGGPQLGGPPKESVMSRRARMTEMMIAMFGRGADESAEAYKERVTPMITGGLEKPRGYATKRRQQAEEAAGVSAEQSAAIDAEVSKIYGDVIDYANSALADGTVSPYSRNVSGWLQFAGGLGSILTDAEGRFGKILSPSQLKTMYDMGFEWGEYLGVNAPWENLNAPPPPPGTPGG